MPVSVAAEGESEVMANVTLRGVGVGVCILYVESLDLQSPNHVWLLQLDVLHIVRTSRCKLFCLEKSEQTLLPGLQPEMFSLGNVKCALKNHILWVIQKQVLLVLQSQTFLVSIILF